MLQWHGEADMVETHVFKPVEFTLALKWDESQQIVQTTATPEIQNDPDYFRKTVHKLIDRLIDELGVKEMM